MFSVQQGKNKLNHITKRLFQALLRELAGVKGSELEKLTEEGYNTMTANGDYEAEPGELNLFL